MFLEESCDIPLPSVVINTLFLTLTSSTCGVMHVAVRFYSLSLSLSLFETQLKKEKNQSFFLNGRLHDFFKI